MKKMMIIVQAIHIQEEVLEVWVIVAVDMDMEAIVDQVQEVWETKDLIGVQEVVVVQVQDLVLVVMETETAAADHQEMKIQIGAQEVMKAATAVDILTNRII